MSQKHLAIVLCFLTAFVKSNDADESDGVSCSGTLDADTCRSAAQSRTGASLLQTRRPPIAPAAQACSWTVFYDKWLPSFDVGEYEHVGRLGGAHCLKECCQDPTCSGIALMSNEAFQCYKYSRLPSELDVKQGKTLGNGLWLRDLKPTWSIFAKDAGAAVARISAPMQNHQTSCGWSVHYDLWIPTFARKEYEPPNAYGGAHCLKACCEDPACDGLALMSNEEYQCYKYSGLPAALATHTGTPLGDGKWLSQKKPMWSIFVKTRVAPPSFHSQISRVGALAAPVRDAKHELDVTATQAFKGLAHGAAGTSSESLLHIAVAVVAVTSAVVLLVRLTIQGAFFGKNFVAYGSAGETQKLLEGIDLKDLSAAHK